MGGRRRSRAKDESEKRTAMVTFRVSDSELEMIDEVRSSTGLSRGRWMWAIAEAEIRGSEGPTVDAERAALMAEILAARRALDRIGVNLNQLVAAFHATGVTETGRMEAILDRVDRAVERVDEVAASASAARRHRGRG